MSNPIPLYVNRTLDDDARRASAYDGAIFLFSAPATSTALVTWIRGLATDAFEVLDLSQIHQVYDVEEFVRRTSPLKSRFVNDPMTKELCRDLIIGMGCDPERTYFDLPRLRVVPPTTFLSSGVSYNYRPHRDTWYAHPRQLINYWVPVFDSLEDTVMSMYLDYFHTPVLNRSNEWDYDEWVANSRFAAAANIGVEARPHPVPLEDVSASTDLRIIQNAGDILMFSTCQLHASAPNTSGTTRFSYDLRTLNLDDLVEGRGPVNFDGKSTGTTLRDFLRVSDFAPLDRTSDLQPHG
ncbi:MAG: hypothetical protein R2710_07860 [Acidimicrobiales bacterium]